MGIGSQKSLLGENYHPDDFSLVWLDKSVNASKDNRLVQEQIRSSVEHLKTFDQIESCLNFLQHDGKEKRIILIVSGQYGREIVPQIHQLKQIFCIYVYCSNQEKHKQWASQYSKVIFIYRSKRIR